MNDPTYVRDKIDANPVWAVAFVLSEMFNDAAPIGWSKYIWAAGELHRCFEIKQRPKTGGGPPEEQRASANRHPMHVGGEMASDG